MTRLLTLEWAVVYCKLSPEVPHSPPQTSTHKPRLMGWRLTFHTLFINALGQQYFPNLQSGFISRTGRSQSSLIICRDGRRNYSRPDRHDGILHEHLGPCIVCSIFQFGRTYKSNYLSDPLIISEWKNFKSTFTLIPGTHFGYIWWLYL